MARGRTIYRGLPASDKYNALFSFPLGEFAQHVYHETYPYSDDWGHLPYSVTWVRLTCFPDSPRPVGDIEQAMKHLVTVSLWEYVYDVFGKVYVYISQFEEKNRDGIRKRSVGEFPDESGSIPRRLYISGNKQEPIEESLKRSFIVRKSYYPQVINTGKNFPILDKMTVPRETGHIPETSGTFRNIPGELIGVELSRGELIKEPESPAGGSLKKKPEEEKPSSQSASSTEKKYQEASGESSLKNTVNSIQNGSFSGQGAPTIQLPLLSTA
jgi:hypothetical protein